MTVDQPIASRPVKRKRAASRFLARRALTCVCRTATIIVMVASGIPAFVASGTAAMVVLQNDNRPGVKEVVGRIRTDIRVGDRDCWTLFDSGARHSYITRSAAAGLDLQALLTPRRSMLGGSAHEVTHVCLVQASVAGHPLEFQASVIDEIGRDEDGRVIDVLFGAIAMQLWGIRLDPQNEVLDFSHFTRDFLEF